MENLIIIGLVANAIAHVISYLKLRKSKSPNAVGVLAFVFINAIIAVLLWQGVSWAIWLALAFPLIGGLALLFTTIIPGKGGWIDYLILLFDIATLVFVLFHINA